MLKVIEKNKYTVNFVSIEPLSQFYTVDKFTFLLEWCNR